MTLGAAHSDDGCDPRQVYDQHQKQVLGYLVWKCRNRHDALEISATAFMKFFTAWPDEGMDAEHAVPWLMTIVKHELSNWARARKRRPEHLVDWASDELDQESDDAFYVASELMSRGDMSGVIQRIDTVRAVFALPRRQQDAVVLCHMVGFTQAETAAIMRISAETVKSHLESAMKVLRSTRLLEGYEIEPTVRTEAGR